MKRRLLMGVAAIIGVFATENMADILLSKYIDFEFEIIMWLIIAIICGAIVYEVGEDRGDW